MTRMWLIDPMLMCDQHLLGEHAECHQLREAIRNGRLDVVQGHADAGQIDTAWLQHRHDELAEELERRGFEHDSPMEYEDTLRMGGVEASHNRAVLSDRCGDCQSRIESERLVVNP